MHAGKNIRRLRKERGLSQKDLRRLAGISQQTISTTETGAHEPHMGTLRKIAKGLGVSVVDLLAEDAPRGTPPPPRTPITDEPDPEFSERFEKLGVAEAGEMRRELDAELNALQTHIRGLKAAGLGGEEFVLKRFRGKLARCARLLQATTLLETEASLGRERKSYEEYAGVPDELEKWLVEKGRAATPEAV